MSRPVRIKEYVASRVDELAVGERRSFANMVEVLLLRALDGGRGVDVATAAGSVVATVQDGAMAVTGRAHMKKNRPAIQCPSREFVDGVCVECGAAL